MKKCRIAAISLCITLVAILSITQLKPVITRKKTTSVDQLPTGKTLNRLSTKTNAQYEIKGSSKMLTNKQSKKMTLWRNEVVSLAKLNPDTVFINGQTSEKVVCLTFDDGPDKTITPRILDVLNYYHIHGNFFFIGQKIIAHPDIVKRTLSEGHLVLNHSYNHPYFKNKSESFISNEINKTNTVISQTINKKPVFIRPPYGEVNNNVLSIAKSNNYKLIIWSTDTLDWSQKDKDNIVNNVLQNVRPGEIILLHSNEDKLATIKALPVIIEGLLAKGYKIITLDKLLNTNAYK